MIPPEPLRSARAWLVWRLIQKDGQKKPSKIPFYVSGHPRGWPNGRPADGKPTEAQPEAPQASPLDRAAMVTFDQARAAAGYDGVGFATFSDLGVVALDFDNVIENGIVDPRVLDVVAESYAEVSPSGNGIRAFFLGNLPSRKDTKGNPSLEVFGDTGFVTFTGNVLPGHALFGWDEVVAPVTPAVQALYVQRFGQVEARSASHDLMAVVPTLGWSLEEARAILADCDASTDRDHWLRALQALHHEFHGSAEALQLADEWSSRGTSYSGFADVEGRWRSFGRKVVNPTTGRWLLKWREECTVHQRYDRVAQWKERIASAADEFTLRERICVEAQRDPLVGELEREALAQALVERFKLMGTKYPIGQCRKMLEPARVERSDAPEWTLEWVYVTDEDQFYRHDSDEWLSMQSFNAKFNRLVGEGKTASWVALEEFRLKTVTRAMYVPPVGRLFQHAGVECVNTYQPSSTPKRSMFISAEGQRTIDLLRAHIALICDGRPEVVTQIESWIAFCVQNPGEKVRWAPLIKGIEGDGKSLIGTLMSIIMGYANVKYISPTVLGTDFSDWAHGACIGVLEEIKLSGHNRYDILNKLKPFITNDYVPVHPKGGAERNVRNTVNYIGFTNHSDALPLDSTDRRWMVIYTPFTSLADLLAAVGDTGAYFDALHAGIQTHASELREFFLTYEVGSRFKPNSSAPMTEEKARMVAMAASPEEEAVQEALEAGGVGVSATVLSSSCLTSMLETPLMTTTVNRVLVKLGWVKVPKRFKWRGKAHIVWTKGRVADLRLALDKTCEKEHVDLFGVPSGYESLFN